MPGPIVPAPDVPGMERPSHYTFSNSFWICVARWTIGPLTAYSITRIWGFIVSKDKTFPLFETPFPWQLMVPFVIRRDLSPFRAILKMLGCRVYLMKLLATPRALPKVDITKDVLLRYTRKLHCTSTTAGQCTQIAYSTLCLRDRTSAPLSRFRFVAGTTAYYNIIMQPCGGPVIRIEELMNWCKLYADAVYGQNQFSESKAVERSTLRKVTNTRSSNVLS